MRKRNARETGNMTVTGNILRIILFWIRENRYEEERIMWTYDFNRRTINLNIDEENDLPERGREEMLSEYTK